MNICILHGYGLSGTGSNIFVKNIARQLVIMGHDVSIMCQERFPEEIDFVNSAYLFDKHNREVGERFNRKTEFKGTCSVFIPDLDRRLLVYVIDRYDGFRKVATFQEASKVEIDDYIYRNVAALKTIIKIKKPCIIHTNHTIMQPFIAYVATRHKKIPFIATVHGSALNFSVKQRKLLHKYALKGLLNSEIILSVSKYNARELAEYFSSAGDQPGKKVSVLPVGTDLDKFGIFGFKDHVEKQDTVKILIDRLKSKIGREGKGADAKLKQMNKIMIDNLSQKNLDKQVFKKYFKSQYESYDAMHTDADVIDNISNVDFINQNIILFVGKYLWTKGVQTLITSLPLIISRIPNTVVIAVGFGQSRAILQSLLFALAGGYREVYRYLTDNHSEIDPGSQADTPGISRMFLDELENNGILDEYFYKARSLSIDKKVFFTGIMTHEELRYLLPLADVFVAPSIFTEAFGTVAVESLACGILPVITYDYGFREVHDTVYGDLNHRELEGLKKLHLDKDFIPNMASNIIRILGFKERKEYSFRYECRKIVERNYAWENIAARYGKIYRKYSV